MTRRKSLLCILGFHSIWNDTIVRKTGPSLLILKTTRRCHHCDWSEPGGY